jgi:hypothetical protein
VAAHYHIADKAGPAGLVEGAERGAVVAVEILAAEPGQAVLTPPVGPRPGMVGRQVVPRVAVGAVVLPDSAPLPLTDIRPLPVPLPGLQQPVLQPAEPGDSVAFHAHRHS